MAAEFPQRKEQLVFLINNYDMMLSVLMVGRQGAASGQIFPMVPYVFEVAQYFPISLLMASVGLLP